MQCPRCGKENPQDAQQCAFCGFDLTSVPDGEKKLPESDFNEYIPREMPPESGNAPGSKLGKFLSSAAHAVFYVAVFLGCQYTVIAGYMLSLLGSDSSALTDPDAMNRLLETISGKTVLLLLIANLITILMICGFQHLRRRDPVWEMELFPVNPFRFGTFALFGAAMNVFVSISMSYLPLPQALIDEHNALTLLLGGSSILTELFSIAVVAGITEEIVFRGMVISRLKKGMGTAAAVVISALLFGGAHGSILAIVYATLVGLLLGALYARYNSILPGMIFHVFFNMTSYFLPEEGAMLTVLYGLSILMVVFCVWRIFIRFPVFNDIFTDVRDRIRPVNDEEAAIIEEVKRHQKNGRITAEELMALNDRWTENRKQYGKEKKYGRKK